MPGGVSLRPNLPHDNATRRFHPAHRHRTAGRTRLHQPQARRIQSRDDGRADAATLDDTSPIPRPARSSAASRGARRSASSSSICSTCRMRGGGFGSRAARGRDGSETTAARAVLTRSRSRHRISTGSRATKRSVKCRASRKDVARVHGEGALSRFGRLVSRGSKVAPRSAGIRAMAASLNVGPGPAGAARANRHGRTFPRQQCSSAYDRSAIRSSGCSVDRHANQPFRHPAARARPARPNAWSTPDGRSATPCRRD